MAKTIELYGGPVDGLRITVNDEADCFLFACNVWQNGTVMMTEYYYLQTADRTINGLLKFKYEGD